MTVGRRYSTMLWILLMNTCFSPAKARRIATLRVTSTIYRHFLHHQSKLAKENQGVLGGIPRKEAKEKRIEWAKIHRSRAEKKKKKGGGRHSRKAKNKQDVPPTSLITYSGTNTNLETTTYRGFVNKTSNIHRAR